MQPEELRTARDPRRARSDRFMSMLINSIARTEATELDMPHIVAIRDTPTGIVSYAGPYSSALAALVAAEQEADGLPEDEQLTFSILPLFPPHEP